jgi:sulfur carrier protein
MMEDRIERSNPEPACSEGEPVAPDASVLVNGRCHPLPAHGNLVQLLRQLGIDPDTSGVAVAVNDQVVQRPQWAMRRLAPGDRVEVVRAVQGG